MRPPNFRGITGAITDAIRQGGSNDVRCPVAYLQLILGVIVVLLIKAAFDRADARTKKEKDGDENQ